MGLKLRQTEVEDFEAAVRSEAQVAGLQVAMDYALLVRGREAARKLYTEIDDFLGSERTASQLRIECCSRNVLDNQEIDVILSTEFMNSGYVGMIQAGKGQGFFAKSLARVFVGEDA